MTGEFRKCYWCRCSCGAEHAVNAYSLRHGKSSCCVSCAHFINDAALVDFNAKHPAPERITLEIQLNADYLERYNIEYKRKMRENKKLQSLKFFNLLK
jgi:hypothetical protein